MRTCQLRRCDEDLNYAVLYLQHFREHCKEEFDSRKGLRAKDLFIGDLVLLRDTKLEFQHSCKLDFRASGPYRIADPVRGKGTYFPKELNEPRLQGTFTENRLKKFHLRPQGT